MHFSRWENHIALLSEYIRQGKKKVNGKENEEQILLGSEGVKLMLV